MVEWLTMSRLVVLPAEAKRVLPLRSRNSARFAQRQEHVCVEPHGPLVTSPVHVEAVARVHVGLDMACSRANELLVERGEGQA